MGDIVARARGGVEAIAKAAIREDGNRLAGRGVGGKVVKLCDRWNGLVPRCAWISGVVLPGDVAVVESEDTNEGVRNLLWDMDDAVAAAIVFDQRAGLLCL